MTCDSGLAPNPFHGFCTLAVCTPNHMRANLGRGDWILGIAGKKLRERLSKTDRWKIIYAMKIDREPVDLDSYYNSPAYKAKIPKLNGSAIEMCGDNFYNRSSGELEHTRETEEHCDDKIEEQDIDGDRVFIGKEFYYFGSQAPDIPVGGSWGALVIEKFQNCAVGLRYLFGGNSSKQWAETDFEEFLQFLQLNKHAGIPNPIDFPEVISDFEQYISHSRCAPTGER